MINSVISKLKKDGKFYKFLRIWYRSLYLPIKSGRFFYMLKYILLYKHKEIKNIKAVGFVNIKPFNKALWRIGKHTDKVERRYYIGDLFDERCFIKIAKNDLTTQNEIEIYKRLKDINWNFIPKCKFYDSNFESDDTVLLANEYIDGLRNIDLQESNIQHICLAFDRILDSMYDVGLVHADIHKGNLMLDKDDNIVLMDFGISCFPSIGNNVDYINRPGTFYRHNNDEIRIYDDAFSFLEMLEKMGIDSDMKKNEYYSIVAKKVDRLTLNINLLKNNIVSK